MRWNYLFLRYCCHLGNFPQPIYFCKLLMMIFSPTTAPLSNALIFSTHTNTISIFTNCRARAKSWFSITAARCTDYRASCGKADYFDDAEISLLQISSLCKNNAFAYTKSTNKCRRHARCPSPAIEDGRHEPLLLRMQKARVTFENLLSADVRLSTAQHVSLADILRFRFDHYYYGLWRRDTYYQRTQHTPSPPAPRLLSIIIDSSLLPQKQPQRRQLLSWRTPRTKPPHYQYTIIIKQVFKTVSSSH